MEKRKNINKKLDARVLVSALVISGILFIAGIFVGYSINREKLSSVEQDMQDVMRSVQNFQLQFLFFDVMEENATCPLLTATLSQINEESYTIGSKLTSYGYESEIQDYNEYLTLKREYSRLLIGYWLLANKLNQACESKASTIVYFFSRECDRCDDQGFILTYLKGKYEDNLLIFALDADLDEPSVDVLKYYYNITRFPSLIVNNELHEGFYSMNELERIIDL